MNQDVITTVFVSSITMLVLGALDYFAPTLVDVEYLIGTGIAGGSFLAMYWAYYQIRARG